MSRRGRRRVLSATERALWAEVTRSVAPLRPPETLADAPLPPDPASGPSPAAEPAVEVALAPAALPSARPAPAPKVPPLASLEPRARRRLTRGAEVDARLDLHGLTQQAAHRRLRQFLRDAQAGGHSVVLVITGKGERAALAPSHLSEGARGVLRRAVPLWLAEPDLRTVVLGFEEAGRRHGGEGALYVRIRRRRADP